MTDVHAILCTTAHQTHETVCSHIHSRRTRDHRTWEQHMTCNRNMNVKTCMFDWKWIPHFGASDLQPINGRGSSVMFAHVCTNVVMCAYDWHYTRIYTCICSIMHAPQTKHANYKNNCVATRACVVRPCIGTWTQTLLRTHLLLKIIGNFDVSRAMCVSTLPQ